MPVNVVRTITAHGVAIMNHIRTFEGRTPVIDPDAWVDPTALVIGDVHIGSDSTV